MPVEPRKSPFEAMFQPEAVISIVKLNDVLLVPVVGAHSLKLALGVDKKMSDWLRQYKKRFVEGTDWFRLDKELYILHPNDRPFPYDYFLPVQSGRAIEYVFTVSMAKAVAFNTKTPMGLKYREYRNEGGR